MNKILSLLLVSMILTSCTNQPINYSTFDEYPTPVEANLWPQYSGSSTLFNIWSPTAEKVQINLYDNGTDGSPTSTISMEREANGIWKKQITGDLTGTYYTFQIMLEGKWLDETPGVYAQAIGVNGNRAMVVDMKSTQPEGWSEDKGPAIQTMNEAIIYELQIRDMTIHPASGSTMPGKYLGLVESGTKTSDSIATGFDHLKELGITHVHLLPAFDHYSIDEANLDQPQFNWGYDPKNYNVPEGSFSTDPFHAEVRIGEFKKMVKAFHDNGIGVILDVVYNHTGRTENSNFNLEVPGYYYRHWDDGKLSDAASCGNETASDRAMMRKFMIESVAFWAKEYHLDGFRFDLMGIHDITTINEIAANLKNINPNLFVYGEGWTAGDSPLPVVQRALKMNILEMPQIAAFSDDIRDGLKGSVFVDESTGFVSGAKGTEESIKFGVVGSIQHSQVKYDSVNYSKAPWATHPWQAISYVSCHDNHTLFDKLKLSRKDADLATIIAMDKLANAIVLTSQGTAFLHAGVEMLRTKSGEHNSYNLPDSVNQMDWNWKRDNKEVVAYYKNLIALRKAHPAFRMTTGDEVRSNLEFKKTENGLISFQIANNANGDSWKNILVIYNAKTKAVVYPLFGKWQVGVLNNTVDLNGNQSTEKLVSVPALSMVVLFQE